MDAPPPPPLNTTTTNDAPMMDDTEEETTSTAPPPPPPLWFSRGHLRDDLAQQLQPLLRPDSSARMMCTMREPQEGMFAETELETIQGQRLLLSGIITLVEPATPVETLATSNSLFWSLLHNMADTKSSSNLTSRQETRDRMVHFLGCVHGQGMKSLSRLNEVSLLSENLPFDAQAVLEVTYKFNDHLYYPWTVETVQVLDDDPTKDNSSMETTLPSVFSYECNEGCTCPRCCAITRMAQEEDVPEEEAEDVGSWTTAPEEE